MRIIRTWITTAAQSASAYHQRMRLPLMVFVVLLCLVPATAQGAQVGAVGSNETIQPQDASIPVGTSISASAARNEFASVQIAVRADAGAINGLTISKDAAFTKAGGGTIPAANVTVYREDYYTVQKPSDGEGGSANPCAANCRWPDALIPAVDPLYGEARNAWPVNVPAGENRVAWIDVLVPIGQAAGIYTGTFAVFSGAGAISTVTVNLTVVDFALPSTSSMQGTFALDWHNICRAYGGNGNDCTQVPDGAWSMYSLFVRSALDNRVSISGPAYGAPWPGSAVNFNTYALPYIKGTGPTRLAGARLATVLLNRWEADNMEVWRAKAIAEGFEDRITFYCDEVGQSAVNWNNICNTPFATAQANWNAAGADTPLPSAIIGTKYDMDFARGQGFPIAAQNGSLQTLIPLVMRMGTAPSPESGAPNWWGPYPGLQTYGNQREYYNGFLNERPGYNRLWLYTSCMTEGCGDTYDGHVRYSGWPSYAIDQADGEARSMAWQVFNYKATGEYYYETAVDYSTSFAAGGQYEDGGNGDGTLFYPGKVAAIGGAHDIPLESMRLKRIREGREDFEYLSWLKSNGQEAAARNIAGGPYGAAGGLMDNMYDSAHSQAEYTAARGQLEALVAGAAPPPAGPTCNGLAVTIEGTDAGETINGTAGNDVIMAAGGDDNIYAGAGNDTICGGNGYDTIRPGSGSDWANGEAADDAIDYSDADHAVSVNLATVSGDGDTIIGFTEVFGSAFADTLTGDDAANFLAGNSGSDTINGAGGNDLIWGDALYDLAGAGADNITPGSGADTVRADAGADALHLVDGQIDTANCGDGTDTVDADAGDALTSCEAAPPVDVCTNIAGDQPVVPAGYHAVAGGTCEMDDVCPNLSGAQASVPAGYYLTGGSCELIPVVDICTNLAGSQTSMPYGYYALSGSTSCKLKIKPAMFWRQVTAAGIIRSCGFSAASQCTYTRPVRARYSGRVTSTGLTFASRPIKLRIQRLNTRGQWVAYSTRSVSLSSSSRYAPALSLPAGRFRLRIEIAAGPRWLAGNSAWQYTRMR